jgi:tetratricopeptide (TPR) repeat protein
LPAYGLDRRKEGVETMQIMRMYFWLFFLIFLAPALEAIADSKTFIKEYTYTASDADSKISSRIIALEQVKRLLLEEIGTFVMSETRVQDSTLTKEKIIALTAGVVQTTIIKESWDGRKFYLKAKIIVDAQEVKSAIQKLGNDVLKSNELEEAREQIESQLVEIEKLKRELAASSGKKKTAYAEYNRQVKNLSSNDWEDQGRIHERNGNLSEALTAYTRSIEANPYRWSHFYNRGLIYSKIGNHYQAIDDFTAAVKFITDKFATASIHQARAVEYESTGHYMQAISDYDAVISVNSSDYLLYSSRAMCYANLGNYQNAISDFTREIELLESKVREGNEIRNDAATKKSYNDIMASFFGKRYTVDSLWPTDKWNTSLGGAYYNRGISYAKVGRFDQSVSDLKVAASLGDEDAKAALHRSNVQ